jgi:hypothetical protein
MNGMFQELGAGATVIFLEELNSIVKSAWGENLYNLTDKVSTFGGKETTFLSVPLVEAGNKYYPDSIFQPGKPSLKASIFGYDPSTLIVHAAASQQGLGMMPRRDGQGQVVFNGTVLTIKAKDKFIGKDFLETVVEGALDDPGPVGDMARAARDFTQTGKNLTTLLRPSAVVFTITQPTGDPELDPDDAQSRFAARLIRAITPPK